MSIEHLEHAIKEAERFAKLGRIALSTTTHDNRLDHEQLKKREEGDFYARPSHPYRQSAIHRAAAKRASMDLTRALAEFRR